MIDSILQRWMVPMGVLAVIAAPAGAGVVTWDGGGDGVTWQDPLNWSGDALPGAGDDVVIGADAVSFSINTTETVASLACEGTLMITNGTLGLGGSSMVAVLQISGGTLGGSGDVTTSGPMTWTGGTIAGEGTLFAEGGMDISGSGGKSLLRDLENAGNAIWSDGLLRISVPATFTNLPGAVLDAQGDDILTWETGGPGTFDNQGTFRKSAGDGDTDIRVPFDNQGVVEVQSGTVLFGSADSDHSGDITGNGRVEFGAGAHVMQASSTVTTAVEFTAGTTSVFGTFDVPSFEVSGGNIVFEPTANIISIGSDPLITNGSIEFGTGQTIDLASYTQSGGTVTGTSDIVVSGTVAWSGGTIAGNGTLFAGGGMDMSSSGIKSLFRDLENAGNALWSNGQLRISEPATFTNLPGAVLDLQGNLILSWETGGPGTFDNRGTFRKSAGDGNTDIRVPLTNSGIVEALSGKVLISGGYTQTDGATRVDTELEFAFNLQMDLLGGVLNGNGLVDGFVNNDGGTINPGLSPGQLDVEGDVDMSALARFTVELGGPNAGEYDLLAVDGDAMLGGLLEIRRFEGYQPAVGTVFTVLTTTGDRIDTFDDTVCDDFFDIRYLAQAVELEVIAELPVADLDQNCSVGFNDLSILLGNWGPCPKGEFCAADFDQSGSVGFNDLSFLLGNWG